MNATAPEPSASGPTRSVAWTEALAVLVCLVFSCRPAISTAKLVEPPGAPEPAVRVLPRRSAAEARAAALAELRAAGRFSVLAAMDLAKAQDAEALPLFIRYATEVGGAGDRCFLGDLATRSLGRYPESPRAEAALRKVATDPRQRGRRADALRALRRFPRRSGRVEVYREALRLAVAEDCFLAERAAREALATTPAQYASTGLVAPAAGTRG